MEIKDLVGVSQPLSKLIEVVSSGIGTIYRPKAIRDEAKAQAFAKKALARAEAEAAVEARDIQFSADLDRIQQLLRDRPELADRARHRLLAREVEGQVNVELIADHAAAALPNEASAEPISSTWRRKFFLEAEGVCEEDMQQIWGKVLAGEVTKPGSYSARTLDTLRQLSRSEAELFRRACAIAMSDGWIAVPLGSLNTSLQQFGLSFGDILDLRDAGLLLGGDNIQKDFSEDERMPDGSLQPVMLTNNGVFLELTNIGGAAPMRIPALVFTRAGQELQRLNAPTANIEYLSTIAASLRLQGLTVKRGTFVPQGNGISVLVFEQFL